MGCQTMESVTMPLLDFFSDYKRIFNAGAAKDPNRALVFLQREYRLTSSGTVSAFDEIWLNGEPPSEPHLLLLNVAKFFNPALPHHDKAIKFLDANISPGTRKKFEQIWHGKDAWKCPSDTDPETGLPILSAPSP